VDAAKKCDQANANIISMSLGGGGFTEAENQTFSALNEKGRLSVAAAGNDGCYDCDHYPASYESVVSVAAIDSDKLNAPFSNCNAQVTFSAPGVDVYSTVVEDGYASWDGTSMATPHVSAVAALVWSSKPDATNKDVLTAMINTTEDLGDPGHDFCFGYGLVQAVDAIEFLAPRSCTQESDSCADGRCVSTDIKNCCEDDSDCSDVVISVCQEVSCMNGTCISTDKENCCEDNSICIEGYHCDNGTCVCCLAEGESCPKQCENCCCGTLICAHTHGKQYSCG